MASQWSHYSSYTQYYFYQVSGAGTSSEAPAKIPIFPKTFSEADVIIESKLWVYQWFCWWEYLLLSSGTASVNSSECFFLFLLVKLQSRYQKHSSFWSGRFWALILWMLKWTVLWKLGIFYLLLSLCHRKN